MFDQKIGNTVFSWEPIKPLENWIVDQFDLKSILEQLKKVKKNNIYINTQGGFNKTTPKLEDLIDFQFGFNAGESVRCFIDRNTIKVKRLRKGSLYF